MPLENNLQIIVNIYFYLFVFELATTLNIFIAKIKQVIYMFVLYSSIHSKIYKYSNMEYHQIILLAHSLGLF